MPASGFSEIVWNDMSCVLVVGASGFLGSEVVKNAPAGHEILALEGVRSLESEGGISALVEELLEDSNFSLLDGIFFCQGIGPSLSWSKATAAHLDVMMRAHFLLPIALIGGSLPFLKPDVRILQLGSVAARNGSYDPIYAGAQAAKESLRSSVKRLLPLADLRTVRAGLIEGSPIEREMTSDFRQAHVRRTRSGNLVSAEAVAKVMWFLYENPEVSSDRLAVDSRW